MSDRFWGKIKIGGDLKRVDLSKFCDALEVQGALDKLRLLEDGNVVPEDDEATYGQFEDLEDTCRELGLPYCRCSDGKYGYTPEIVFWQPGMDCQCSVLTDHAHNMQVSMADVRAIRDALVADDIPNAFYLADRAVVDVPELPPFVLLS